MEDFVEHTVNYVVSPYWSRIGTFTRTYVDVAFQYYLEHKIAESKRIPQPPIDQDPTDYAEREEAYELPALKAVVFAGLAVEAAIYEIAAAHLTDKFTQDHLERIDVVTKWALVPRLICGKPLDSGGPAMNTLRELIQVRNLLVHHKSKPVPALGGEFDEEEGCVVGHDPKALKALMALNEKVKSESQRIVSCAETGMQAIVCLSLELEELLGVPVPALGHYSAGWISGNGEPEEPVRHLINTCRKKVADRTAKTRKAA